jgi:hypothetical protein
MHPAQKGIPEEMTRRMLKALSDETLHDEALWSRLGNSKSHVFNRGQRWGERRYRHGRGGRSLTAALKRAARGGEAELLEPMPERMPHWPMPVVWNAEGVVECIMPQPMSLRRNDEGVLECIVPEATLLVDNLTHDLEMLPQVTQKLKDEIKDKDEIIQHLLRVLQVQNQKLQRLRGSLTRVSQGSASSSSDRWQ